MNDTTTTPARSRRTFRHFADGDHGITERYDLVDAVEAARTVRNSVRAADYDGPDEWLAACDAAEAEFRSHIAFKKSDMHSPGYRRFDVAWDGTYVGWVIGDADGEWTMWLTQPGTLQGRRVATDRTRIDAVTETLCLLSIYGMVHYGWHR